MSSRGTGRGRRGGQAGRPIPPGGGSFTGPNSFRGNSTNRGDGRARGGNYGSRAGPMKVFSNPAGSFPQPDANMQKLEDESLQQSQSTFGLENLKFGNSIPVRPGYGTQGRAVVLWANYFLVSYMREIAFYRYEVKFAPGANGREPSSKIRERLIVLTLEQHLAQFRRMIATDFSSLLISCVKLAIPQGSFQIAFRREDEAQPRGNAPRYELRIDLIGSVRTASLVRHLESTNQGDFFDGKGDVIQALNIIFGSTPKSSASTLSLTRNRHFPIEEAGEKFKLGAGLEAIRGYILSVRPATGRLLLNVQIKHAALIEEAPLGVIMKAFLDANAQDLYRMEAFLKRVRCKATYGDSSKIHTIHGLASLRDGRTLPHPPKIPHFGAPADKVEFWFEETFNGARKPGYVSVTDYFKRGHNFNVLSKGPVVNTGTSQKPIYLPIDVMTVIRGQTYNRALSAAQTQRMISFAVRKPHENASSITIMGMKTLGLPQNDTLREFALSMVAGMITVPGRVLRSPKIVYGKKNANTSFGSWNMSGIKFNKPVKLPTWSYLMVSLWKCEDLDAFSGPQDLQNTLKKFFDIMVLEGLTGSAAIKSPEERVVLYKDEGDEARLVSALENIAKTNIKVVLVILPQFESAIYKRLKYLGDVRFGLHVVCVVGSKFKGKLDKDNSQYWANVALKFNIRLGGTNQLLSSGTLGIIDGGRTMVVGIDVTHPSPGSIEGAPSVAGIAASIDKTLAQFPAEIKINPPRQEPVAALQDMMASRLRLWEKKNGNLPQNIIVYRDGVSEGQYNIVLETELVRMRDACKNIYPAEATQKNFPRFTIIICGKRHHTRFYPTKTADADSRSANPESGTVVDRGVTEVRLWDFFLQAHAAPQGTARPAHYVVILDEIFRRPENRGRFANAADALEDLTHSMCYMQARCTKAVSLCPPAYYADMVCERARCYLSRILDPSLGGTPAPSTAAGGEPAQLQVNPGDVRIHPNLVDSMFYL